MTTLASAINHVKPEPVLTFKFGDETHEIYFLNVGDWFPDFGGSKRGLCVGENQKKGKETASIIYRIKSPMSQRDMERDIHDKTFWAWVGRMIRNEDDCKPDDVK